MKKILLLTLLVASVAFAKSAPRTHDGLFINGSLGLGYGNYLDEYKNDGLKLQSEGVQIEGGFKIGFAIIPNLILHGTISLNAFASEIKVTNKDGEQTSLVLEDDELLETVLLGGGLTYYIPGESNIYLSASLGLAKFTEFAFIGIKISEHDPALGFNLSVGKEWWVNNELGVGVALSYKQASTKSKLGNYKGDSSFRTISAVASVTFN